MHMLRKVQVFAIAAALVIPAATIVYVPSGEAASSAARKFRSAEERKQLRFQKKMARKGVAKVGDRGVTSHGDATKDAKHRQWRLQQMSRRTPAERRAFMAGKKAAMARGAPPSQ